MNSPKSIHLLFIFLALAFTVKGQHFIKLEKGNRSIKLGPNEWVTYLNSETGDFKVAEIIKISQDSLVIFKNDTISFNDFVLVHKRPFLKGTTLLAGTGLTSFALATTGVLFVVETFSWSLCDEDCDAPFSQTHPNTLVSLRITLFLGACVYFDAIMLQIPKNKDKWTYSIYFKENPKRFKSKSSFWFWQKNN